MLEISSSPAAPATTYAPAVSPAVRAAMADILAEEGPSYVAGRYIADAGTADHVRRLEAERRVRDFDRAARRGRPVVAVAAVDFALPVDLAQLFGEDPDDPRTLTGVAPLDETDVAVWGEADETAVWNAYAAGRRDQYEATAYARAA